MEYLDRLKELLSGSVPEVRDAGTTIKVKVPGLSEAALLDAYRTAVTTGAKVTSAAAPVDLEEACTALQIDHHISEEAVVTSELDDPKRRTPMALTDDGDLIYLLGPLTATSVADFSHERLIGEIMIAASRDGLLNAGSAVTSGGFLVALTQMALLGKKGARFWVPDGTTTEEFLFSSSPGRIICIVPRSEEVRFSDMCVARYVPLHRVGVVDGDRLELQDHFSVAVAELA